MSQIEFYKPTIKRKDMDGVLQTMVDEKIGPGCKRMEFQEKLSSMLGLKDGLVLRTYLDAIDVAFRLAKLDSSMKVAISPLSPLAYSKVADSLGLTLVVSDIDKGNCCLSTQDLLNKQFDAIVVHEPLGSIPAGLDYKSFSVPVIEDVSQSIGSEYHGQKVGDFSDIVICSLEDNDLISAAGGAFVGVKTSELASDLKSLEDPLLALPDLNSALGLVQIDNLIDRLEKRKDIFKVYRQNLLRTEHKLFGLGDVDFETNGGFFSVLLQSRVQDVVKFGFRYQVPIFRSFENAIGSSMADDFETIPVAIPYILRCVSFPIYPFLTKSEIETISKVIGHLP